MALVSVEQEIDTGRWLLRMVEDKRGYVLFRNNVDIVLLVARACTLLVVAEHLFLEGLGKVLEGVGCYLDRVVSTFGSHSH